MDNGILFIIIIALGAVIAWQASKLKQYRQIERLLSGDSADDAQNDQAAKPSTPVESSKSTVSANSGSRIADSGPAVAEDESIEHAKKVQLVMARCRYAEFYIDQLDDDYERDEFRKIIQTAVDISEQISDPFHEASALQPIILLLNQAGWNDMRDSLLARVKDELVKSQINEQMLSEEQA